MKYNADTMDKIIDTHGRLQAARGRMTMGAASHEGYCVKCKTKRTVSTKGKAKNKNGTHRVFGDCPTCGTSVHRMVGKNG